MFIKRQFLRFNKTYRFNKAIMNYNVIGQGQPVILLHGSMNNYPWNGFDRFLSNFYTVYLPDFPGFGASQTVNNRIHNTNLFAEVLAKFIKLKNLEKTPVVALSLGTIVAMKTALNNTLKGKLILVGVPTTTTGENFKLINKIPLFLKRFIASTEFGRKKILLPILRKNSGISNKKSYLFDKELYRNMLFTDSKAIVDPNYYQDITQDIPKLIKSVQNKIAFIYGENDPQKTNLKKYGRKIVELPGLGHNIFAENPSLALSIIKKYL